MSFLIEFIPEQKSKPRRVLVDAPSAIEARCIAMRGQVFCRLVKCVAYEPVNALEYE